MNKNILEESIVNEAERQLPLPIGELYTPLAKLSDEDAETRYLTVAISKNQIDLQVDALEAARLKSFAIDVKPLALARAVNRKNAIICEIEQDRAELAIVVDGVLKLARILHFRGRSAGKGARGAPSGDRADRGVMSEFGPEALPVNYDRELHQRFAVLDHKRVQRGDIDGGEVSALFD